MWMLILLADGRSKVRFALRVLLERQLGLEVVGEAVDAQDLLNKVEEDGPDLVLLDWDLPGLQAEQTIAMLREFCPELSVIVMSGRPETQQVALNAGVDAFIHKTSQPESLLAAIEACRDTSKGKP
jgi:DNA-binding NarL/FixJ family response regulator